jgi:aconitase A
VRFAAAIACAALLQACVYLPRTTSAYDEECQVETRHMHLAATQIGAIGSCTNRDCAYVLVAIGAVAAATAVVSGSIVLVGNVVYWLERQGKCALA